MKYKPKKSLGQNFLKSVPALKKIVEAGEVSERDTILEIGPGKGILTEKLLEKAGKVMAIEKDRELFELLKIKFEKEIKQEKLVLINEDILKFNVPHSFDYKIIANIPYNITGAILKKFLSGQSQPKMMILLVQKEVAQRITASDKKESILSISVKAYGEPKIIMKVPARYFSPSPKVDSAAISIKNISKQFFATNDIDEKKFWEIVHAGFAHKRKKLSSNLKNLINQEENEFILSLGNKRAEDLALLDWANLVKSLNINKKSSF